MVFSPLSWVPQIHGQIPDSIPVGRFALDENTRLPPQFAGKAPLVDAISGKSYSTQTLRQRVEWLARALSRDLGWSPNEGSPWDKVIAIHSLNTIDYFVLCWAIHRLNGICLPIHSTSVKAEIISHMTKARCRTIFTCQTLTSTSVNVANELSIPMERVYTLALPENYVHEPESIGGLKSLELLVIEGSQLEPLEPLKWDKGQGKSQVAYLCATSGTSGKQKLAMITHYNLIANIIQVSTFEGFVKAGRPEVATGPVPFSHSYGLLLGHLSLSRGDSLVVFPRFDMQLMLKSIPQYRAERLYLVPPILAAFAMNPFLLSLFDISSVNSIITAAAPLDRNLAEKVHVLQPKWQLLHAYGLTETVAATFTSAHDILYGSSGSLVPEVQLRLVGPNGEDIQGYEESGEILVMSPSIFAGYLGEEKANKSAFDDKGWLRTGDIGMMKMGPKNTEHLFIRERVKDMIKVKGVQVIPADIESLLCAHPAIIDAAVIGIPDELAGERPLAFVVRSASVMAKPDEAELRDTIDDYVRSQLDETHWLHERIVFVPEIARNQSGKVLKKDLRAMALAN